jgi:hypothetical protein
MLHWDEPLMVVGLQQLHDGGVGPFREWEPAGRPASADSGEGGGRGSGNASVP